MGEQKTPRPFVSACDRFCYIDNILKAQSATLKKSKSSDGAESGDKSERGARSARTRTEKSAPKAQKTSPKPIEPARPQAARAHEVVSALDAVDSLIADAASDDATSVTDIDTITDAISAIVDEMLLDDDDGWVLLSDVGNVLRKRYPDFDQRNYGYSKMTTFITGLDIFETKKVIEDPQNPKSAVIYIRNK